MYPAGNRGNNGERSGGCRRDTGAGSTFLLLQFDGQAGATPFPLDARIRFALYGMFVGKMRKLRVKVRVGFGFLR